MNIMIKLLFLFLMSSIFFLFIISRKEVLPQNIKASNFTKHFYKISIWVSRKIFFLYKNNFKRYKRKKPKTISKVEEQLVAIHPLIGKTQRNRLVFEFYLEKMKIAIIVITIGTFVGIAMIAGTEKNISKEQNSITRSNYGQGEKKINLIAEIKETGEKEELSIVLPERIFSEQELNTLFEDFKVVLSKKMLGKNASNKEVINDLDFITNIEEYPFQVKWYCSSYEYLSDLGELAEQIPSSGVDILVIAEISYDNWKKETSFELRLYAGFSPKKTLRERIEEKIIQTMNETKENSYYILPDTIEGNEVIWSEKASNEPVFVFFGIIIAIIILSLAMDYDLKEQVGKREEQMLIDYPELVSKICLLLGAGMTVRSVFQKIAKDYEQKKEKGGKKRYVYEEIIVICYELESGISESESYDNFARRCKQSKYLKLGSTLSQNIKKGSSKLREILEKEAENAFEDRKGIAKKRGEEAGTKLLLPMMLMMAVVMIIIIVPAFLTFDL